MTRGSDESADGAQPLIGSKLAAPKPAAKLVARPHLMELMDRCSAGRVTLISAPAGYGKTTLVTQWLDADPSTPIAWVSLDRLDNDLGRFVRYVAAALARVDAGRLSETEESLSAFRLQPPLVLAETLVLDCERLSRRTVLVLDDYGFIRTEAVHELVSALVSKLPSALHLVIVSRIDPPLPLVLWRSRHWLHELRAEDLRCTRDETKAVVDISTEIALSDEGIDVIHRKTEGWITGLRLALLSLTAATDPEEQVRAFSASDRLVADYLMDEVVARQPPEIREFLAITSVLERFNPELCDELLTEFGSGSAGQSREILDRLYRRNLFLAPLGPAHGWYRYHHLFRQLLLERHADFGTATSQTDLLKRAGAWFCAEGWIEDGLTCFLAANDLEAAEDVIGAHLHQTLDSDLSKRTLARWLEMFPPGADRGRLPLMVASSYMKAKRADYEGLQHNLESIDALCRNPPGNRQREWRSVFRLDIECLRAIASYWNGNPEGAFEHGSWILDRQSDSPMFTAMTTSIYFGGSLALTGRRAEYLSFVEHAATKPQGAHGGQPLPFLFTKTVVHMYRGELAQCRAAASRLTTSPDFAMPKYFEVPGYYFLGFVAYERNQLDETERHFLAVQSRRLEAPVVFDHACAAGLAQIELARGRLGAAQRHADVARSIAIESGSSMLLRGTEAVERFTALAAGKRPDVPSKPPLDSDFVQISILQPLQSWARAQIQSPSLEIRELALEVISAALHRADMHGVTIRVIQLSALRALALDALNRRAEAIPILETTLRRGADLGLVRSFLDLGEGIRSLLEAVAERRPDDEYVAQLLDAFAASVLSPAGDRPRPRSTAGRNEGAPFEDLTNREMDVLELLQQRLRNKEIAARLGISAATVKSHTLGIYGKLGVQGRREAVRAAIELGILPG
ncbi:MAG: hypothetical protein KJO40_15955 [Deltaproteobacteria bacterium]|nr:hypothetical protein [Deltaproteobacteria bacterium]